MSNEELKQSLLGKLPVILTHADGHEGEYKCVSAIIYRNKGGKIAVSAELLDKNENCVVCCDPKKVRLKTEG